MQVSISFSSFWFISQAVSGAANSDDLEPGRRHLFPEGFDVGVHCTRHHGPAVEPGVLDDLVSSQHPAVRPGQDREDSKLSGGEYQTLSSLGDDRLIQVDEDLSEPQGPVILEAAYALENS